MKRILTILLPLLIGGIIWLKAQGIKTNGKEIYLGHTTTPIDTPRYQYFAKIPFQILSPSLDSAEYVFRISIGRAKTVEEAEKAFTFFQAQLNRIRFGVTPDSVLIPKAKK